MISLHGVGFLSMLYKYYPLELVESRRFLNLQDVKTNNSSFIGSFGVPCRDRKLRHPTVLLTHMSVYIRSHST